MPMHNDKDWDNRKAFPDCQSWYAKYKEHSLAFSRSVNFSMDNVYGPRPRNRIDILPGKPSQPTVFHIHGGYWQWNNKEDYLCVGEGLHRHGINTAFIEHSLAPNTSMDEIVSEIHAGLSWFRQHRHEFGIENPDIIVSGHSSGGHLAAMCQGEADVIGTLMISGIYDLRPITQIYVNDVVRMENEMSIRNSPALFAKRYDNFALIAYGDLELDSFKSQSRLYHQKLFVDGMDTSILSVNYKGHFDVLDEFTNSEGAILEALIDRLKLI